MSEYSTFTSESVSEGHPDKLADQISDAILDSIIARDPYARVAVETLTKTGMAVVAGELTTNCYVDFVGLFPGEGGEGIRLSYNLTVDALFPGVGVFKGLTTKVAVCRG